MKHGMIMTILKNIEIILKYIINKKRVENDDVQWNVIILDDAYIKY